MSTVGYYLLAANGLGFFLYLINMWLCHHTEKGQIDALITVWTLIGGSAGILLAILLFDRKPGKGNMMSRVFISCVFVVELVVFLFFTQHHTGTFTLAFWKFFEAHPWLPVYLGIMNVVTFVVFAVDKFNAAGQRRRVPIVTLLGLTFLGGSIGAMLAMYLLRHKTKKDYFTVGVPLILVMHLVVLLYAMNMV